MSSIPRRSGLTLAHVLGVFLILGVLACMFLPSVRNSGETARRVQYLNNLRNIAIAIQNYEQDFHALPPANTVDEHGNRLHSWRTLILPYLDEQELYEKIDLSKPWSDSANAEVRDIVIDAYHCPELKGPPTQTIFQAIVGPENYFHPERPRQRSEIKDGDSQTVMLMEALPEDAVHWMSPNDVNGNYLSSLTKQSETAHDGGVNVIFGDGAGRFWPMKNSEELRKAITTIDGGEDLEKFLSE